MKRPRLLASIAIVALACFATGCGGADGSTAGRSTVTVERTETLYVMGSGATVGVGLDNRWRDAWPRIFYREAFPRATVFVNGAIEGASVADADANQLPLVNELSPAVVAIWLGTVEASQGIPIEPFATNLADLVGRVRATGARVLLADLAQSSSFDVRPYNRAIARVAADEQATLVPLHEEPITFLDPSSTVPDVAGHLLIARAFERALRS